MQIYNYKNKDTDVIITEKFTLNLYSAFILRIYVDVIHDYDVKVIRHNILFALSKLLLSRLDIILLKKVTSNELRIKYCLDVDTCRCLYYILCSNIVLYISYVLYFLLRNNKTLI